eukprot:snap_masked-scaffold_2-processed-gene-27.47-mRNA-1 protein AED:1.00 eAED:1.00 QI:0/-1/0/0/-1/1/1/0/72
MITYQPFIKPEFQKSIEVVYLGQSYKMVVMLLHEDFHWGDLLKGQCTLRRPLFIMYRIRNCSRIFVHTVKDL